jgi:hypothetical protein
MLTVRHLEREYNSGAFSRLMRELLAARGEASPAVMAQLARPVPTAAMVMIRLDELGQAHVPLFGKLLRLILSTQQSDGGWKDPLVTALVLRALRLTQGAGPAVDKGFLYLTQLQKDDGLWPAEPLRRMPGDAFVTAWVCFHLGSDPDFRRTAHLDDALAALELLEPTLSPEAKRLWTRANRRRPLLMKPAVQREMVSLS